MEHLRLTKVSDDKSEVLGFYFASNPTSRSTFYGNFHICKDEDSTMLTAALFA